MSFYEGVIKLFSKPPNIYLALILVALGLVFFSVAQQPADASELGVRLQNSTFQNNTTSGGNITVEVYHFHGTHQCYSCIRVGELAEKTVNTYFKEELASGKMVFGHVNGDLPENQDLVAKYGATGSSLWIGTYTNGNFNKEQNVNVWYKIENEQDYSSYLKSVLEERLSGVLD